MYQPLVSVICLSHNHKNYIERAVKSVLTQSYKKIEIILVDDASTDGSEQIVQDLGLKHNIRTLILPENLGNCKAFNLGFSLSKGDFVIDLAADDVLYPERLLVGVQTLTQKGETYGVHFCDIDLIDENGETLGTHFQRDADKKLVERVHEGDMYELLLEKYYISTPTMMIRSEVLKQLGGYDEELSYEDFDFWVRSSRQYNYCFSDQILMQKQLLTNSHSSRQYQRKNPHSQSTAKVCAKALKLNRNAEENTALLKRINYELKWALITENWHAAKLFLKIKREIPHNALRYVIEKLILMIHPRWYGLWKVLIP